jgi:hypothetical protein
LVTDKLTSAMEIANRIYCLAKNQNDPALWTGAYGAFANTLCDSMKKGGTEHDMTVHHLLEQILNEYVEAAGLRSGQPDFKA